MRALIQRVSSASVSWDGGQTRSIGKGLLVYLGVGKGDTQDAARRLAEKILNLRIFSNEQGKFDLSLLDTGGQALVVSQFTLYADVSGGRRPAFTDAAPPTEARALYEHFTRFLAESNIGVRTGEFAAHMKIESVNDGPVTLWLDTELF